MCGWDINTTNVMSCYGREDGPILWMSMVLCTYRRSIGPYTDGPTVDRRIVQHLDRRIYLHLNDRLLLHNMYTYGRLVLHILFWQVFGTE